MLKIKVSFSNFSSACSWKEEFATTYKKTLLVCPNRTQEINITTYKSLSFVTITAHNSKRELTWFVVRECKLMHDACCKTTRKEEIEALCMLRILEVTQNLAVLKQQVYMSRKKKRSCTYCISIVYRAVSLLWMTDQCLDFWASIGIFSYFDVLDCACVFVAKSWRWRAFVLVA